LIGILVGVLLLAPVRILVLIVVVVRHWRGALGGGRWGMIMSFSI